MLVVEKGQCREERWYNFMPTPFSDPQEEGRSRPRTAGIIQGRGQASSA